MALDASNTIMVTWEPPSFPTLTALDSFFPGYLFGGSTIDENVDFYELQVFDPTLDIYLNKGYFYSAQAAFPVSDLTDAKVRIRAILKDGTKTSWSTTGSINLFSFEPIFSDSRNIIFLSFV